MKKYKEEKTLIKRNKKYFIFSVIAMITLLTSVILTINKKDLEVMGEGKNINNTIIPKPLSYKENQGEFILNKDIIESLDVTDLFVYASNLSNKFRFNYKNDRLYIKLLLSGLEKHYVYYLVELFEHILKIKE